ncbi:MAG: hypothetical protein ACOYEN_01205 [Limnochordia bacterium]
MESSPTCEQLRQTGPDQRRWLSLPGSRLVVNPYGFWTRYTPVEYSNGCQLPLNVGYYANGTAVELPEVHSLWCDSGEPGQVTKHELTNWSYDSDVQITNENGQIRLRATGTKGPWGTMEHWLEVDLDNLPYFYVSVPVSQGSWALKVKGEGETQDLVLQKDTDATGSFLYDVVKATGWQGKKRFKIRFFTIGVGKETVLNQSFVCGTDGGLRGADCFETSWSPEELGFRADYQGGKVLIEGSDFFYDENTLVRTLHAKRMMGRLVLAGRGGTRVTWDQANNVLTVDCEGFSYSIALPHDLFIQYARFSDPLALRCNKPGEVSDQGYWALYIDSSIESREIQISLAFSVAQKGNTVAFDRALVPLIKGNWLERKQSQTFFWNRILAKVPQPKNFALVGIEPLGVTPCQIRRAYYSAWVFVVSSVLPIMEETGFGYPQMSCGKPSLWAEGAYEARPSASWESFFGIQFLAYVDPNTAWQAFQGLMSLVDEEGVLGGESLPSRKAQTAMVLYQLTGNKEELLRAYPAIKRYLLWRRKNPRWTFKEHDYPDVMDLDFVVSALIDMKYAQQIAEILDAQDDISMWKWSRESFFADCLDWFWETPTSEPVEYHNIKTGENNIGNPLWISTALHLDLLEEGEHLTSLTNRFFSVFDPNRIFCGFEVPKYPELSFVVYGLYERGFDEAAGILANICVRDVTRANMFAEQYLIEEFPYPDGVRPSMFGAALLIDMLWVKNGYRYDLGIPCVAKLPGEIGGMRNLEYQGEELRIDLSDQGVKVSGGYVGE